MLATLCVAAAVGLARGGPLVDRRAVIAGAGGILAVNRRPAAAASSETAPRAALLEAIAAGADLAGPVAALIPLDPSRGAAATSPAIDGEWRLIGSVGASAFSPLLNLPPPIRPASVQLLGNAAAAEVGDGRIAQRLDFPLFRIMLSSGARAVAGSPSVIEILPPFRLELLALGSRLRV